MENEIKKILNLFNTGDFNNTIRKTKKLSRENPKNSFLKNLIGSAFLQINNTNEAIKNFKLSVDLSPTNVAARNNLANAYKINGEYKLAEKCYQKTLYYAPNYVLALVSYGNLKTTLNETYDAIELFKKALSIKNNNYIAHFNLATAYQTIGEYTDALNHAKLSVKNNPSFTPADKLISSLIKYSKNDPHFLNMKEKLNDEKINRLHKVYLHFGVAKAYEDLENFDKFIEHIKKGNEIRKNISGYNIKSHIDLINKIKLIFKDINFSDFILKNNNKKIIFVLGMPRSGSTLIEQIISSHPDVYGAGELPELPRLIKQDILNVANSSNLLSMNFNEQTSQYMKFVSYFKSNKKFITDKNPSNFLWIGFIKIMFPNAKIIHTYREPKDNCLSIFKNLFPGNDMAWCYDQKELGQYYNLYEDLMQFWNKLLPNSIYNIKYENLIEDQESEIKKLISACGLEWNVNCLNSHQNNKPIRTLSISQARQKIYKTSLNLSDNFKSELNELFTVLSK